MSDPIVSRVLDVALTVQPSETADAPTLEVTRRYRPRLDEEFPRMFGRYELRALLGQGGMGAVYLAYDLQLERLVALKIPRPVEEDPTIWRERFLSEARSAATLQHPNICPVFEVGEVDARPYLTMAYIEGETLAARTQRIGPSPIPDAVDLVRTIARAMAEAHERGIVHRDLKPANIIIDRRGQPVVMDFGLALRITASDDLRLTLSGVAMGTPAYMPPEQAGGDHDAIGPPSDVYSLGVILYELIVGRVPFQAKTFGKLLAQIERDHPPRPSTLKPTIDPALDAVILTALAKAPQHRFASAKALADALDAYARGERDAILARHRCADGEFARLSGGFVANELNAPPARARRIVARRSYLLAAGIVCIGLVAWPVWQGIMQTGNAVTGNAQHVAENTPVPNRNSTQSPADETLPAEQEVPAVDAMPVAETSSPVAQKQVAAPAQATIVEVPGWQILADASLSQMQQWLDDRKKNEHSVLSLDVVQVEDEPIFTAIAALDGRQKNWKAFLDLTEAEINNANLLIAGRLKGVQHVFVSVSGYFRTGQIMATALLHPGDTQGIIGVLPFARTESALAQLEQQGYVVRLIRPFPTVGGHLWCALYGEAKPGQKSLFGTNLQEADLIEELETYRDKGFRPTNIVGYSDQRNVRFAVASWEDPTTSPWEVRHNLTTSELNAAAAELTMTGLRPASVTACPWDGAVRYTTVWLNESPSN